MAEYYTVGNRINTGYHIGPYVITDNNSKSDVIESSDLLFIDYRTFLDIDNLNRFEKILNLRIKAYVSQDWEKMLRLTGIIPSKKDISRIESFLEKLQCQESIYTCAEELLYNDSESNVIISFLRSGCLPDFVINSLYRKGKAFFFWHYSRNDNNYIVNVSSATEAYKKNNDLFHPNADEYRFDRLNTGDTFLTDSNDSYSFPSLEEYGRGTESIVFDLGNGKLAKVYAPSKSSRNDFTTRRSEKVHKLLRMIEVQKRYGSLDGFSAWPQEHLYDANAHLRGFTMKKVNGKSLDYIKKEYEGYQQLGIKSYSQVIDICKQIIALDIRMQSRHGCMVDNNLGNYVLDSDLKLHYVDIDSIHIAEYSSFVFYRESFFAYKEVYGKDFSRKFTDYEFNVFRTAFNVWHVLMIGIMPYKFDESNIIKQYYGDIPLEDLYKWNQNLAALYSYFPSTLRYVFRSVLSVDPVLRNSISLLDLYDALEEYESVIKGADVENVIQCVSIPLYNEYYFNEEFASYNYYGIEFSDLFHFDNLSDKKKQIICHMTELLNLDLDEIECTKTENDVDVENAKNNSNDRYGDEGDTLPFDQDQNNNHRKAILFRIGFVAIAVICLILCYLFVKLFLTQIDMQDVGALMVVCFDLFCC